MLSRLRPRTRLILLSTAFAAVAAIALDWVGPLIRSLVDDAGWLRDRIQCPLPRRIQQVELLDLSNAVTFPPPRPDIPTMPTIVTPTYHSQLNAFRLIEHGIIERLAAGRLRPNPVWQVSDSIGRAGAAAWQIPELPLAMNPARHRHSCRSWSGSPHGG